MWCAPLLRRCSSAPAVQTPAVSVAAIDAVLVPRKVMPMAASSATAVTMLLSPSDAGPRRNITSELTAAPTAEVAVRKQ